MKRYRFSGTDSRRLIKYNAEADTLIGLYNELVSNGTISELDESPYDEAILKKQGKKWDDFDGDYNEFQKWVSDTGLSLTDDEIVELIYSCDGNAYYSTIEMFDGEEYVGI